MLPILPRPSQLGLVYQDSTALWNWDDFTESSKNNSLLMHDTIENQPEETDRTFIAWSITLRFSIHRRQSMGRWLTDSSRCPHQRAPSSLLVSCKYLCSLGYPERSWIRSFASCTASFLRSFSTGAADSALPTLLCSELATSFSLKVLDPIVA